MPSVRGEVSNHEQQSIRRSPSIPQGEREIRQPTNTLVQKKPMTDAPSSSLAHLLARNRVWSQDLRARDPQFFQRLAEQQAPKYLWIGCSDSRVPANQIIDM